MKYNIYKYMLVAVATFLLGAMSAQAGAATKEDLNKEADQALKVLYKSNPVARDISKKAKEILVFPKIYRAGLVFGGSYGEGVLFQGSRVDGYYNSVSASWGWQAGVQSYSYVVFLMNDRAVNYLKKTKGW